MPARSSSSRARGRDRRRHRRRRRRADPLPRGATLSARAAAAVRLGALGGQDAAVSRRGAARARAHRVELRGRRHRAVFRRRRHLQALRAAGGARRRHRHRQFLGISHGSRRCRWWCRKSTRRRSRGHAGIIANPNCCAIISITPLWPIHQVNRIRAAAAGDLPGGLGRRRGGDGGAARVHARLPRGSRPTSTRCCRILMPSTSSATTPGSTRPPATTTRRPRSSRRPARSSVTRRSA